MDINVTLTRIVRVNQRATVNVEIEDADFGDIEIEAEGGYSFDDGIKITKAAYISMDTLVDRASENNADWEEIDVEDDGDDYRIEDVEGY